MRDNLDLSQSGLFDITRNIHFVPPFVEKDVEKNFPYFEKVALTLKWPRNVWLLFLQPVLTGHAQEVYAALSVVQSAYYNEVKASVLHCYELVPEAYQQRYKKTEHQTYMEFGRKKEALFDLWCSVTEVNSQAKMRELMLVEEFKNCISMAVSTYLEEISG